MSSTNFFQIKEVDEFINNGDISVFDKLDAKYWVDLNFLYKLSDICDIFNIHHVVNNKELALNEEFLKFTIGLTDYYDNMNIGVRNFIKTSLECGNNFFNKKENYTELLIHALLSIDNKNLFNLPQHKDEYDLDFLIYCLNKNNVPFFGMSGLDHSKINKKISVNDFEAVLIEALKNGRSISVYKFLMEFADDSVFSNSVFMDKYFQRLNGLNGGSNIDENLLGLNSYKKYINKYPSKIICSIVENDFDSLYLINDNGTFFVAVNYLITKYKYEKKIDLSKINPSWIKDLLDIKGVLYLIDHSDENVAILKNYFSNGDYVKNVQNYLKSLNLNNIYGWSKLPVLKKMIINDPHLIDIDFIKELALSMKLYFFNDIIKSTGLKIDVKLFKKIINGLIKNDSFIQEAQNFDIIYNISFVDLKNHQENIKEHYNKSMSLLYELLDDDFKISDEIISFLKKRNLLPITKGALPQSLIDNPVYLADLIKQDKTMVSVKMEGDYCVFSLCDEYVLDHVCENVKNKDDIVNKLISVFNIDNKDLPKSLLSISSLSDLLSSIEWQCDIDWSIVNDSILMDKQSLIEIFDAAYVHYDNYLEIFLDVDFLNMLYLKSGDIIKSNANLLGKFTRALSITGIGNKKNNVGVAMSLCNILKKDIDTLPLEMKEVIFNNIKTNCLFKELVPLELKDKDTLLVTCCDGVSAVRKGVNGGFIKYMQEDVIDFDYFVRNKKLTDKEIHSLIIENPILYLCLPFESMVSEENKKSFKKSIGKINKGNDLAWAMANFIKNIKFDDKGNDVNSRIFSLFQTVDTCDFLMENFAPFFISHFTEFLNVKSIEKAIESIDLNSVRGHEDEYSHLFRFMRYFPKKYKNDIDMLIKFIDINNIVVEKFKQQDFIDKIFYFAGDYIVNRCNEICSDGVDTDEFEGSLKLIKDLSIAKKEIGDLSVNLNKAPISINNRM